MVVRTDNAKVFNALTYKRAGDPKGQLKEKWVHERDTIEHWQPRLKVVAAEILAKAMQQEGASSNFEAEVWTYPIHIRTSEGANMGNLEDMHGAVVPCCTIPQWREYFRQQRRARLCTKERIKGDWAWELSGKCMVEGRRGWVHYQRAMGNFERRTVFNARFGGILKSGMSVGQRKEMCSLEGCNKVSSLTHVLEEHGDWAEECKDAEQFLGLEWPEKYRWWRTATTTHERQCVRLGYVPKGVAEWMTEAQKKKKGRDVQTMIVRQASMWARRSAERLILAHGFVRAPGEKENQHAGGGERRTRCVTVRMGSDGGCMEEDEGVLLTFGGWIEVGGKMVWEGWGHKRASREENGGGASPTLAEYHGMVGTLTALKEWLAGCGETAAVVDARLDSLVVERQADGEHRCKEVHLRIGREAVRRLLTETGAELRHVLREDNQEADKRARAGRTGTKNMQVFVEEWECKGREMAELLRTHGVKRE
jgi:hypothetical protein